MQTKSKHYLWLSALFGLGILSVAGIRTLQQESLPHHRPSHEDSETTTLTQDTKPLPAAALHAPHLQRKSFDRHQVLTWADTLIAAKRDAFADEQQLYGPIIEEGAQGITLLGEQLRSNREIEDLPQQTVVVRDRPQAVLRRMAMIDGLEYIASTQGGQLQPLALKQLEGIVHSQVDGSSLVQKIRRAEIQDAFTAIARVDQERAFALLKGQEEPLAALLKRALIAALVDKGLSRAEASKRVAQKGA